MSHTIRLDLPHGNALSEILGKIRAWLDREHIEPIIFNYAEGAMGLTVDVSFATQEEAERFRQRFVGP